MSRPRFVPQPSEPLGDAEPFESGEAAWFWAVQAAEAKAEGARIAAGLASVPRPCEPVDIAACVQRLHRQRRLIRDHLCVLRHYGRRRSPPVPQRRREARAATLWREAFEAITPALRAKGIVA